MVNAEIKCLYQGVPGTKRGASHNSEVELLCCHEIRSQCVHTTSNKYPSAIGGRDVSSIGILRRREDHSPPRTKYATSSPMFADPMPNASPAPWDERRTAT
jgi:hypothetical protein